MARPPQLPDSVVQTLIAELRGCGVTLTGTRLRTELRQRYGCRGGVERIYRLLQTAQTTPPPPPPPTPTGAGSSSFELLDLQTRLTAALKRAELAEYREEQHQARWASEIHELRERVRTTGDATRRVAVLEGLLADRAREMAAAHRRIADLEQQLGPT